MPYISTLHSWNCHLFPLLGFPLNLLLFWLILKKTPKEMRAHSRILLPTCIVDLLLLSICAIATPLCLDEGSVETTFLDGLLFNLYMSIFNKNGFVVLYTLANFAFTFDLYTVSVQFVYRYLVLNRNFKIKLFPCTLMFAIPLFAALSEALLVYVSHLSLADDDANKGASFADHIDWSRTQFVNTNTGNLSNLQLFLFIGFNTICNVLNLFCGIKMLTFVRSYSGMNAKMMELNRQLNKTLIILAMYPSGFFLFNMFTNFVLFTLLFKIGTSTATVTAISLNTQLINFILPCWITVLNPLVSIWINRPYRDAVANCCIKLSRTGTHHLSRMLQLSDRLFDIPCLNMNIAEYLENQFEKIN